MNNVMMLRGKINAKSKISNKSKKEREKIIQSTCFFNGYNIGLFIGKLNNHFHYEK